MRPPRSSSGKTDLFRERLDAIINDRHPLVRLTGVIPWTRFDEAFGGFYRPVGRPATQARPMVGLQDLKHVHDLYDEETVERWIKTPYGPFFCGFEFFQYDASIDPSTMTRWRKRIGPDGLQEMLKASDDAALEARFARLLGLFAARARGRLHREGQGADALRVRGQGRHRDHDDEGGGEVVIAGRKRGLTPTMKRELKRPSVIGDCGV